MTTDDGKDNALPRSIEALWDLREKVSRKARPGLSLERIVEAAIECADTEGLAALSMAKVAKRLDSATMSLYRHVASKDELQALMVDVAYGEPPALGPKVSWRVGLEQWARAFLDVFYRHPWMLQVTISGPPLEPGQLTWLERGLSAIGDTGLRPDEKLSVMLAMIGYVRSTAQLFTAAQQDAGDDAEQTADYGRTLAKFVDAESFPAITELVESGIFDNEPVDEFTFGLERMLDGIEMLIRNR
jgi:AcrR family transcriptional regulator